MSAKSIEIRAIFTREKWRSDNGEGDFMIGLARPVEAADSSPAHSDAHSDAHGNGKPKPTRVSLSSFDRSSRYEKHADEFSVLGNCEPGELQSMLEYRFWGHWEESDYGRQFKFKTFVLARPHTQAGIVRYLSEAGKGCGFGPAMAQQLYSRFAGDSVRILREQPDVAAAAVPRLSTAIAEKVAERLAVMASTEECSIELMDLLHGRGFPKKTAQEALRTWGNRARQVIESDPFKLMRYRGVGFLKCDAMYLDLGLPPDRMRRQAICVWYACASDTDGHTWLPIDKAKDFLKAKVAGVTVNLDKAVAIAKRLGAIAVRYDKSCQRCGGKGLIEHFDLFDGSTVDFTEDCPMCDGKGGRLWIAEGRRARAEKYIAEKVAAMLEWKHSWPTVSGPAFEKLSEHQKEKLTQAMQGAICSLGGSPGTGKTFTAAALIRAIIAKHGEAAVAIAAPTGKAAVRCNETMAGYGLPIEATTIHRLLGVQSADDGSGGGWSFVHGEFNPLPYRFIVLDECFPASTLIDTPNGKRPIYELRPGDEIFNAYGIDSVVATKKTKVTKAIRIRCGAISLVCSENHPIFTNRGVVVAGELRPGDCVVQTESAMRLLRSCDPAKNESSPEAILFRLLRNEMVASVPGVSGQDLYGRTKPSVRREAEAIPSLRQQGSRDANRSDQASQSNIQSGDAKENFCGPNKDRSQAAGSRRQWHGTEQTAVSVVECIAGRLAARSRRLSREKNRWLPDVLQARHCEPRVDDWNRSRWPIALRKREEGGRCEEGSQALFARVDGVEILESGHPELDQYRDADGSLYFYDIQAARHPSFSVEGCLVHNCSMIGCGLMASVLSAVAKGSHVIMVGDVNQLLPVEHGAPLRDLLKHIPYGELVEIHRNAGSIVKACAAIRDGRAFKFDSEVDLEVPHEWQYIESSNGDRELASCKVCGIDNQAGVDSRPFCSPKNLVHIPASQENLPQVVCDLVEQIRDSECGGRQFDAAWDTQVLVAVNKKSIAGREAMNERLQLVLNPGGDKTKGGKLRVHDKVINLANKFMKPADGGDEKFVANGEFGAVRQVHEKKTIIEFLSPRKSVIVPHGKDEGDSEGEKKEGESSNAQIALGYAVTVHKCQGSSAKVIIVIIDEYAGATGSIGVCDKHWLFTALSRAERICYVVGQLSTIQKISKKSFLARRKTFLSEILTELANERESEREQQERPIATAERIHC